MDYRLRDAVLGFLAPGTFDPKGFPDSGHPLLPSEFLGRLASIREDTPDAAYYSMMNLVDSHDTERVLWTLTPGAATLADKQQNAANVAAGKQRVRLASLIQFTLPGAPTIYYGDEVGLTGDDRSRHPAHLSLVRPGRHAGHQPGGSLHRAEPAAAVQQRPDERQLPGAAGR